MRQEAIESARGALFISVKTVRTRNAKRTQARYGGKIGIKRKKLKAEEFAKDRAVGAVLPRHWLYYSLCLSFFLSHARLTISSNRIGTHNRNAITNTSVL